MWGFDPVFPWLWIVLSLLPIILGSLIYYYHLKKILGQKEWWWIVVWRTLWIVSFSLLLLNPYWIRGVADPQQFSPLCLIDLTRSMNIADCDGQRRIDVVNQQILADSGVVSKKLWNMVPRKIYGFAGDRVVKLTTQQVETIEGVTDIDGALRSILELEKNSLPSFILLVSDGLDNYRHPAESVLSELTRQRVPVYVIGLGETSPWPDLMLHVVKSPKNAFRQQPFTLGFRIERQGNFSPQIVTLRVLSNGQEIKVDSLQFQAGVKTLQHEVKIQSPLLGYQTYQVSVDPLPRELNLSNNACLIGVHVLPPPEQKILLMTHVPDVQVRFMQLVVNQISQAKLNWLIKVGEVWRNSNGEKQNLETFNFANYDILLIPLRTWISVSPEYQKLIREFVTYKGGGLLFLGNASGSSITTSPELSKSQENIYQDRWIPPYRFPLPIFSEKNSFKFYFNRLIPGQQSADLIQTLLALKILPGQIVFSLDSNALSSPLTLIEYEPEKTPLLFGKNIGVGRIAWFNIERDWLWYLHSQVTQQAVVALWKVIFQWLSRFERERIELYPSDPNILLGERNILRLFLLDADYNPSEDASVQGKIIYPDQRTIPLSFLSSPHGPGIYEVSFFPDQEGPIHLEILAKLTTGEILSIQREYLVSSNSPEMEPHPQNVETLKKIAEVTGGVYWNWNEIDQIDFTHWERVMPKRSVRVPLGLSWANLLLLILCACGEWWFRRHLGLR